MKKLVAFICVMILAACAYAGEYAEKNYDELASTFNEMDDAAIVSTLGSMERSDLVYVVATISDGKDVALANRMVEAVNRYLATMELREDREALARDIIAHSSSLIPGAWNDQVVNVSFSRPVDIETETLIKMQFVEIEQETQAAIQRDDVKDLRAATISGKASNK